MRSYQIIEFGAPLQETTRDDPEPQGTEVLVRVSACGVCHSDVHLRQGYFDLGEGERFNVSDRGLAPPFTLGHEIAGEVAALGPEAVGVEVGEPRLVFPWIGCGECETCAAGDENLCLAPRTLGTRRDGGYSDHVMVPHPRYLLDYAGIDEDLACISACSGITAYSALSKVLPLGGRDRLLLIGAGGVGLMGLRIAAARTEAELIVADIDPVKRAAAREAGAAQVIDPAADGALEALIEASGGGVAAAIDFVGAPASAGFGLGSLRRGGKLVIVGLYGGKLSLVLPLVPLRPITIMGSYVGTLREMNELLDLIRAGHVTPIPITERPLSEANAALEDLQAGKVVGRTVLRP
jgi:D-arabinose 1-dehydrogenase-like Zn-dependent alcohol dehydrogenase